MNSTVKISGHFSESWGLSGEVCLVEFIFFAHALICAWLECGISLNEWVGKGRVGCKGMLEVT